MYQGYDEYGLNEFHYHTTNKTVRGVYCLPFFVQLIRESSPNKNF